MAKIRERVPHEERRQNAYETGMKLLFLTCPLCGRGKPIRTWKGQTVFEVKPDYAIIQARYGVGGRGMGGFYLKEDESVYLKDLQKEFPDVYENLREQVRILYELLWEKV